MRFGIVLKTAIVSGPLLLAGCGWMGGALIDNAAGIPVSDMISDVKETADEYGQEKQEERVDELSREYEEFLRSRDTVVTQENATEQSVVIQQQDDSND